MKNKYILLSMLFCMSLLGLIGCKNDKEVTVESQFENNGMANYFGKYEVMYQTDTVAIFSDGVYNYDAMTTVRGVSSYDNDDVEDYYVIIYNSSYDFSFEYVDKAFNENLPKDGTFQVIEKGYYTE